MGPEQHWQDVKVGAHLAPEDGACLMELVSLVGREPWSDHPRCTHPLLAHLARRVNDAVSDRKRSELAPLVPELAVANSQDPSLHGAIAATCLQVVLDRRATLALRVLHEVASRRAAPAGAGRHRLYERGTAFRSVDLAVFGALRLPPAEADEALHSMLTAALEVVARSGQDRPPGRARRAVAASGPGAGTR